MDFGPELSTYKNKTIGVYGGKFYPFHKGHLSCILKAQSEVDILFVIVHYDEEHERHLANISSGYTYTSHRIRERWITEELREFPNIRVLSVYEPRSDNYMNDPRLTPIYENLDRMLGGIDKVFSNEHEYTPYFAKYLPNAEHVVLFGEDLSINICATTIRESLNASWNYLPAAVQSWYVTRISIGGVESSGKTHLTKMLAKHYHTNWVPEYGRTYYDDINGCFDIDQPSDYDDITAGHLHLLNQGQKEANLVLLADTDLIYTQYFHIRQHGHKNALVEAAIQNGSERLHHRILLAPNNPYELDGTRKAVSGEDQRQADFKQLQSLYDSYDVTYTIIDTPDRLERFATAVQVVDGILKDRTY